MLYHPKALLRGDSVRISLNRDNLVVEGKVIAASENENGFKVELTDSHGRIRVWHERVDGGSIEKVSISLIEEVKELIEIAKCNIFLEELRLYQLGELDRAGVSFDDGRFHLVETDIEVLVFSGKRRVPGYHVYRVAGSELTSYGTYRLLRDATICVLNRLISERISCWEQSRSLDKLMTESNSRIKL